MIGKRKHKESKMNVHLGRPFFLLSNLVLLKNAERQKRSTQQFNIKSSTSKKKNSIASLTDRKQKSLEKNNKIA